LPPFLIDPEGVRAYFKGERGTSRIVKVLD
jgi:hypothetical protein